jgi:chromosome segregation ATPase
MAKRVYVSSHESDFFINNTIDCAPMIPEEGNHKVGDLIISSIQRDEIIGWVCVKDGNPGDWESIRNAGEWLDTELNKIKSDILEIKIFIKNAQSQLVLIVEQIQDNTKNIANNKASINNLNNVIEQQGVLIGEIEDDIEGINSQINVAKQALNVLTTQVTNNSKAINTINTSVGANGVASKDSVDAVNAQIDKLKEMLGINDSSDGGSEKGVLQQLEELRELIGVNDEADEVSRGAILGELTELRRIVGLENREDGEPSLQDRLDDIEGEIEDLHEAVDEVKEQYLKFWVGTNAEYQALTRVEHGRLYIIID